MEIFLLIVLGLILVIALIALIVRRWEQNEARQAWKNWNAAFEEAHNRAEKLAAFKAWVHKWLDNNGVPIDPDPHTTLTTGCRISGRMEWLKTNWKKE